MTVHDRVEAISLIHDGVTCMGAVARCLKTGQLRVYLAKATLIATGGYGRLYRETTNAVINDGSRGHPGPEYRHRPSGEHGGRAVSPHRDCAPPTSWLPKAAGETAGP